MRAPLNWLAEHVELPAELTGRELGEVLIRAGLEVETVDEVGADVTGPIVVGQILAFVAEPQANGKTIRWVQVDVGAEHNQPHEDYPQGCRSVVCGADNFAVGDLVVVALPGSVLAGDFAISARKTYGHLSDGMICAEDELGIGTDHTGIIVLPSELADGSVLAPGDDPAEYLLLRDDVLDIDVSPDIGYCLSIRGLARETAQNLGGAFTDVVDRATPATKADGYPVVLADPACPLFVALSVSGIDPSQPTPRWMARRLVMAGMRSISLAVDITNYVMLETGQPLHAYDASLLQGPIVVRKANPGETLVTLDDQKRTLDPDDLLITDDTGPIGLAGVMGGESTELRETSTDVLIEAANFDPTTISRTLRRHNLPSEASKRFHRGVDPNAAYSAAHLAARLLEELAGGTLWSAETVAGAVPQPPTQTIAADLPTRILGLEVSADRVAEILSASGCQVSRAGDQLSLVPPTWRPDLRDPYDYVEEVGRKVGLDKLPSVLPSAPAGRGLTREQRAHRAVGRAAVASGFVEVLTFPFAAEEDLDRMAISPEDPRRTLVRLANPLAGTAPYLRTSILPALFASVARNTSRGNDDLAIFETGSVFRAGSGQPAPLPAVTQRPSVEELAAIEAALPVQPRHFAAVLCGSWRCPGWAGAGEPAGWQQVFALVDALGAAVGAPVTRLAAAEAPWHPGRCAAVVVAGEVIGHAGELHPSVVGEFGLPERSAAVEIDLDRLVALAPHGGSIAPVSGHPVAKEDIAVVVPDAVSVGEVQRALAAGAGELLESISLFDLYTGGQVPDGHRSLAFALRFRAPDRTLTDAETAAARQRAVVAAAELGAVLRDF
ncbi:phenylalanine--tRNA ligase subunit beta [Propionicimonas sp.]|uniref:phenylalanine--tRNA ligase subunit beta n=1 Tax=Propionicimonas sp. TaxID=1955623 RepID=UPI0017ACB368|nr:phenylalanine--tRNA ligase subunit beta [Propionicimonas sp.]MBU3976251.1 phenylalanine--tRNA ligase subunit beta [Actinomycetota bacterium]MBA3021063.1 phenylalanine--tRNA ligase subunit beta [Propionicimonas sp.]MBU3985646.1 phenylalanine--tRNA ligase subunit beta [Actinomycetota bacterium]MBU4008431.1 phenylalanine--tRNA ligase subunit beta [Actinomycetota bacterium]MBU4066419.1 phenylalanine--tRNA ligase subunit beta [Actinomycetota bacterium]